MLEPAGEADERLGMSQQDRALLAQVLRGLRRHPLGMQVDIAPRLGVLPVEPHQVYVQKAPPSGFPKRA